MCYTITICILLVFFLPKSSSLLTARVVNGTWWAGRLEILYNGTWNTVCDDDFTDIDAQVACRMLGFKGPGAVAVPFAMYGEGQGNILLDNVGCQGTETSLEQCPHRGYYIHNCQPYEDVGVICNNRTSQVRLKGTRSTSLNMGIADILINDVWSMLCDISVATASVICRLAGYPSILPKVVDASTFGPQQGRFLNARLSCVGNETNIFTCLKYVSGYINSCPTGQGAGVICSNASQSLYIVVAANSAATSYPLLEGTSVTLKCEKTQQNQIMTSFTWPETAGGRPSGEYLTFDNVTRDHNGRRVKCEGNYLSSGLRQSSEILVLQAYYPPTVLRFQLYGLNNKTVTVAENSSVDMLCQADGRPTPLISFVRIKDNNRVLISKLLGSIQVTEVRQELRHVMNQIQCEDSGDYRCEVDNGIGHDNQTARLLVLCAPRRTKSQAQVPFLDVDISSGPMTLEIMGYPTPFVAGTTFHAEVLNDRSKIVPVENTLNVTCHVNTSSPALVTCKVTVVNLTQVTQGFYTTVLKNSFGQLAFPFKINRKAGLLPARLVNGVAWAGRLEILANGFWSTVCDDAFGKEDAQVACRMLGYRSSDAVFVWSSVYGAGQGSIILDDLRCNGTEASLTQCLHLGLYTHDCNHGEDIGVICSNGTSQVRLTGTRRTSVYMGRADFLINGEWSMLCDISETTAKVICRLAGYPSIEAKVVDASTFGPFQGRFLNAGLNCVGNETNIFSCLTSVYGYRNSCPTQQGVGVICSNTNQALYIVVASSSAANSYPLIQGTNIILKCERTRRDQMITNFTWPETAGGRPFGEYLTFDNVTREHNGRRVKCEGSYLSSGLRHSTVSEILVLQTYYYPLIRVTSKDNACQPVHDFPNHCTITEGDNFTLQCEADSNPPPASITWSGKVSSSNGRLSFVSANRSQHGGEYMCTVVTQSRADDTRLPLRSSHRLTVLIKYPPTVLRFQLNALNNKTVTVAENSSVEMLCQAEGRPTPRMSFVSIKDNNHVLNSKPLGSIQVTEVRQELRHVINQIQCENSGDYRCEVDNGIGHDNQTVRLLVLCPPRRTNSQEQVPFLDVDNSDGPLTVAILGYPAPFIAGTTFHGEVLDDRSKGVPVENTLNVTCHANISSLSLVTCNVSIVNLTHVTQGFYTTIFKNSIGELAFSFKINCKETGTKDQTSSLSVGAIIGGGCAAVVVVLVIIIGIVVARRRRLKAEQEAIYDNLNLRRRCDESPYAKPSVRKGEAIEVFTLSDAVSAETDDGYGTITQLQKSRIYENVGFVKK